MRLAIATMLAAAAVLTGCGGEAQGNTAAAGKEAAATSAPADVSDGLITCAMPNFDNVQGITLTERFILIDGEVKRYLEFSNEAFDLCEPGQEGCSLALEDGVIRMDHLSEKGVRSRYDVDLASMDIEARKTRPGEDEQIVAFDKSAKCVREPLPEGLTVN
ncbi:MAG: hypothetical protein CL808_03150 [Citromicrobium sp.]|nr:hypothetical protein [Citromicrobium sp.]